MAKWLENYLFEYHFGKKNLTDTCLVSYEIAESEVLGNIKMKIVAPVLWEIQPDKNCSVLFLYFFKKMNSLGQSFYFQVETNSKWLSQYFSDIPHLKASKKSFLMNTNTCMQVTFSLNHWHFIFTLLFSQILIITKFFLSTVQFQAAREIIIFQTLKLHANWR